MAIIIAGQFLSANKCAFSQSKNDLITITFCFKDKKFVQGGLEMLDEIKSGQYYQIAIVNLNSNLYKVSLNGFDTLMQKPVIVPSFTSLATDGLYKLLENLTSSLVLSETEMLINQMDISLRGPNYKEADPNLAISEIVRSAQQFQKDQVESYLKFLKEFDEIKFRNQALLISDQSEFSANTSERNFTNILDSLKSLRIRVDSFRVQLLVKDSEYSSSSLIYSIGNNEEFKKEDANIKTNFTLMKDLASKMYFSLSADSVSSMLMKIVQSNNVRENKYVSVPFRYMGGDYGSIDLKISPRDEKVNLQSYSTKIRFPSRRINNFSIGTDFYISGLHDQSFSSQQFSITESNVKIIKGDTTITDTSFARYKIIDEGTGNFEIGVKASVNWFPTKTNWFVTFGPAISLTKKIKPRVCLGGGYGYGDKDKLSLSLGLIFGYTDKLSNGYNIEDTLESSPQGLTISKMNTSFYLSIGYLFDL